MVEEKVRGDGYYQRYPGDYQRDTRGLSLAEHGAYNQLLDSYYSEEELPSDLGTLYRITGAMDDLERKAVDKVVKKYFKVQGERLIQDRVERQLAARRAFLNAQSRKGKLSGEARRKSKDGTEKEPGLIPGSAGVQPGDEPEGEPKPNQASASASASALPSASAPASKVKDTVPPGEKPPAGTAPQRSFTPPTLEQVTAYCRERGNGIDPQYWIDSYTAKGWMIGKSKMRDWKAAIRTWEKNKPPGGKPQVSEPRGAAAVREWAKKEGVAI